MTSRASGESKARPILKKTSCRPINPKPTGRQRWLEVLASGGRIEVDVDDPIKERHDVPHYLSEPLVVHRFDISWGQVRAVAVWSGVAPFVLLAGPFSACGVSAGIVVTNLHRG